MADQQVSVELPNKEPDSKNQQESEKAEINRSPIAFDDMAGISQDGESDFDSLSAKSIQKKSKWPKHDANRKSDCEFFRACLEKFRE